MPVILADTPVHDANEWSLDMNRVDRQKFEREGIVDLGVRQAHGPVRGSDTLACGRKIAAEVGDQGQGAIESPITVQNVGIANNWASIHNQCSGHQHRSSATITNQGRASSRRSAR